MSHSPAGPPRGAAFLLTQLGTHAAMRFADRVAEHQLTPPQVGVLGLLSGRPGISQQELADVLGMLPSRVVALVDELEDAGYVQRVRDDADRRRNALQLTDAGRRTLALVGRLGRAHEQDICAALTDEEHETLVVLLGRMADQQGLTPGVHPGYRTLRPAARS
ncbi:MAG TPA: MarR family winged helix-turn-helix transcriptional regulator [Jatrophihabitans sp.]|jgi:DNA-binding MarR family transcriptional regulator|nr:MarR family winged helix-turn-helix transcriptional regulator [Jatrophihabitans sp.]